LKKKKLNKINMEEQETRPGVRSLIEATFRVGRDEKVK
jgi:hypothetical protein